MRRRSTSSRRRSTQWECMFELALLIHPDALAAARPGQPGDEYELDTVESQLMAACERIADAGVAECG